MTTEEKIRVMQAHIDGEYIEFRIKGEKVWTDCGNPLWDWQEFEYRTKPKLKTLTDRPYKDTTEMIDDYKTRFGVNCPPYAMPLIWVKYTNKYRDGYEQHLVTYFGKTVCALGETMYDMETLYNEFTYLDGSPIGKMVE